MEIYLLLFAVASQILQGAVEWLPEKYKEFKPKLHIALAVVGIIAAIVAFSKTDDDDTKHKEEIATVNTANSTLQKEVKDLNYMIVFMQQTIETFKRNAEADNLNLQLALRNCDTTKTDTRKTKSGIDSLKDKMPLEQPIIQLMYGPEFSPRLTEKVDSSYKLHFFLTSANDFVAQNLQFRFIFVFKRGNAYFPGWSGNWKTISAPITNKILLPMYRNVPAYLFSSQNGKVFLLMEFCYKNGHGVHQKHIRDMYDVTDAKIDVPFKYDGSIERDSIESYLIKEGVIK